MKVFHNTEAWDEKVNFIDENNVVLGYDMRQCCCEHADWFIADKPTLEIIEQTERNPDLTGWTFDPDYFQEHKNSNQFYDGGMAIFRIRSGKSEKFIHLFNCQNGYYGHGFSFKVGGDVVRDSCL